VPPNSHNLYRPDIDGLRAIAVLSVIGFHAFPGLVHGGFIGVDIFFVISGFLISTILLKDLIENQFSLIHFFTRRILRIFPSLILVLATCWVFGWIDLLPEEYRSLGKHIAGGGLFIDNFLFWQEIGYFDQSSETKPLLHLWSLGVEEQFYLIYPLLLWIGFKKSWGQKVLYGLFLGSFLLNIYFSFTSPSTAFFLPFTRFWEFLFGAYVAIYFSKKDLAQQKYPYSNLWPEIIPIAGMTLIAISFFTLSPKSTFPGFWAVLPTLGAAMVIFSPQSSWINRKLLSNPILVKLGLISYPLYLWHWPLLSFAHIMRGETPSSITRITAIGIAFICAWASYRWLEYPIRFGGRRTFKTIWLLIGMALITGLGLSTYLSKGFPERIPEKYRQLQELFQRTDNASTECIAKFGGGGNSYCRIGDISKEPTTLLIGDSHAGHFFEGLNQYYLNKDENLLNMGAGGCPPFYGIQFAKSMVNSLPLECHHYDAAFKTLFNSPTIKTVIFAFDHAAYLNNTIEVHFQDKAVKTGIVALKETIEKIQSNGKKVILIYDMPDLNIDLKKCFSLRPYELGNRSCDINEKVWKHDFEGYNKLIEELRKNKDLTIYETGNWIEGNFPIDGLGYPMYMDKTHLNSRGSLFFLDKYNF
jgi:peptidoglycan/LPS O-acetylase OafA/YrhL